MSKAATPVFAIGLASENLTEERFAPVPADSAYRTIAFMPEFRALLASKKRFIGFATAFYLAFYFALIILVGFAPEIMARPIFGGLNLAYVFALSQFFMAWGLAALYLKRAGRYDAEVAAILRRNNSSA